VFIFITGLFVTVCVTGVTGITGVTGVLLVPVSFPHHTTCLVSVSFSILFQRSHFHQLRCMLSLLIFVNLVIRSFSSFAFFKSIAHLAQAASNPVASLSFSLNKFLSS
jgi:hypothetical protein